MAWLFRFFFSAKNVMQTTDYIVFAPQALYDMWWTSGIVKNLL